ncbi:MAG TPA: 50S ribosomal protein L22 [Pyrinomonadaceae bacterium]|nr:50S ribosomal protein L22 [Pyrinomonadaceae bacterium]
MEARASARHIRGSAQKARLVVDMIRGKNVNEALAILQFTNKRAAGHVEKCVRSAIANASEAAEKANVAIDVDELWVKAAYVDRGKTKFQRRMRPAPQGRAYRERRHFCHVTVLLSNDDRAVVTGNGKAAETKPAKLEESRSRKRGGAAAAPRAKRTASKAEGETKTETKRASKKSDEKKESANEE